MLKNKKYLLASIGFIFILYTSIIIIYPLWVLQQLNTEQPIGNIQLDNFSIKTKGEVCVGDIVELQITIRNLNERQNIKLIITDADESIEKDITIESYTTKSTNIKYIFKQGGEHTLDLYYKTKGNDREYLGRQQITVTSFKDSAYFVLTYFHFNIQFVCGDTEIENRIINGSITKLLEFYHTHPQYKFTFEIQGYAIEIMAERHSHLLEVMRKMINRGQMELVVGHYSDQFFVAYPRLDLQKSIDVVDMILDENGLQRSNVYGCQEFQYSAILPEVMRENDYNIFVGRAAYFRRFSHIAGSGWHLEQTPIFESQWNDNKVYVVVDELGKISGLGNKTKTFFYDWASFGDGEGVNTGKDFMFDEGKQRKLEEKLESYEKKGYQTLTVSEMVYTALEKGFKPQSFPYIPESAQGRDEGGIFIWMGRSRNDYEQDITINTLRYKARTSLLAAETLINIADKHGYNVEVEQQKIRDLWKALFLAEVTDATGHIPRLSEVQYGLEKSAYIIKSCENITQTIAMAMEINYDYLLNTKTQDIVDVNEAITPQLLSNSILSGINITSNYNCSIECLRYTDSLYLLNIKLNASNDKPVKINFDSHGVRRYSPALGETEIVDIESFAGSQNYFPLTNGWISLSDEVHIIKVCFTRHIAMRILRDSIVFSEETGESNLIYQFFVFYGTVENANAFANDLNVNPTVLVNNNIILYIPIVEKNVWE